MSLFLLFAVYAGVLGLLIGSYLNVVVYRLPRDLSTVRPRSRCPSCEALITARDNVPVLSYLWLRGRCRHCRAPISPRYPLVELTNGLLYLGAFLRFGPTLDALAAALLSSILLALALIDFEHYILPDRITLPGIVAGLALSHWLSWTSLVSSLIGVALGGGLLLALWWLWLVIRKEEGMGLGDVKMLAMVGAFLGWQGVLVTLFLGALSGAVIGVALIAFAGGEWKSKLPFGVFLSAGAAVALFFGPDLMAAYLSLF